MSAIQTTHPLRLIPCRAYYILFCSKNSHWTDTLTDVNIGRVVGNTEIAGLDIDGQMCGQLTELKLQNFIV